MGSGRNRKKSDMPLIRRPKNALLVAAQGLEVDGGSFLDSAPDVCIPSFDVKVKKSYYSKANVIVQLRKKENVYVITVGENEIGELGERYSDMISTCMKMGIRYAGEIILKNENAYARFIRISRS